VWIAGSALFAAAAVAVVLTAVAFVHSLYPRPEDPRQYVAQHRAEMDEVATLVHEGELRPSSPDEVYYGPQLPEHLRHLSATGRVSILSVGTFFIPRWTGIPDDAGGYWYSPSSPEGQDMYGMACTEPLDLANHWWSCGMVNDGPG
jgi:hypothetical protein